MTVTITMTTLGADTASQLQYRTGVWPSVHWPAATCCGARLLRRRLLALSAQVHVNGGLGGFSLPMVVIANLMWQPPQQPLLHIYDMLVASRSAFVQVLSAAC
jgi:hypothetical protein